MLTGGLVPLSVTLATDAIFRTFSRSERKVDALLHGHSYTAYPVGCEVANETLDMIEELKARGGWAQAQAAWKQPAAAVEANAEVEAPQLWSHWDRAFVETLSHHPRVDSVMALGCVVAVEIRDASGAGGYQSTAALDVVNALRRRAPDQVGPTAGAAAGAEGEVEGEVEVELEKMAIHARPLGNVVYLMTSLDTQAEVVREVERLFLGVLGQ